MDIHLHHHIVREPRRTGALALFAAAVTMALTLAVATPKSARTKLNDMTRQMARERAAFVAPAPTDVFMHSLGADSVLLSSLSVNAVPGVKSDDIVRAIRRNRRAF